MIRQALKLNSITEDYYSCKLCKNDDVSLDFGNVKLHFKECLLFKCGYPNEEIYLHYDYYTRGSMKKYCLYEIVESEWIEELKRMNKVHPRNTDEILRGEKHFIILFEDEVFECIASSYELQL